MEKRDIDNPTTKIAILGATGHIAKGLIYGFCQGTGYALYLFARSPNRVSLFMQEIQCSKKATVIDFKDFSTVDFDVIINCIGVGDPQKLQSDGMDIFRLTETFDGLILDYLRGHPSARYINFSSGAVHGTEFNTAIADASISKININSLSPQEYYSVAKLNSEAKHRALTNFKIVDLRIFGYFSRFINLDSAYLMCEIISCIKSGKTMITGVENVVRDYLHITDLVTLVDKCIQSDSLKNNALDAYSLKPTSKFEILKYFHENYGLKYIVDDKAVIQTATGSKLYYYSDSKRAETLLGYRPQHDSLGCLAIEAPAILQK